MTDSWLTLPEALDVAASSGAGLTFVNDDGSETYEPYEATRTRAGAIAQALARRGVKPGQRVALLIPESLGFIPSFFGVSLMGAAAVPMAPPLGPDHLDGFLDTCRRMVQTAEVSAIITSPILRPVLGTLQAAAPGIKGVWSWTDLVREPGEFRAEVEPSDVGLLQFTSGSTSHPKGVVLSHANLAANVKGIVGPSGLGLVKGDVAVSWLPLFHDMGLIGLVIGAIGTGTPLVLMPPLLFVKRPVEWLRAISRHKGTHSFAPNFAYELTVRRAGDKLAGLDLSSWRVAGCGAEPIRPAALALFSKTFESVGFHAAAFLPCYGLAEFTLAATLHPVGQPIRVDRVNAKCLSEKGRAIAAVDGDAEVAEFVSCGKPLPGHTVRIVGEHDKALPDRQVGEVRLHGPSMMQGYYEDDATTRSTIERGWLRTGDLGYVADGELFLCGRKKDLIIVRGRNYYPQDLEWAAGEVSGVRRGCAVAFGVSSADGTQDVVLVAERADVTADETLPARLTRKLQETSGLTLRDVVIVPKGALPKTSSGKVQRSRVKSRYEAGTLFTAKPRATAVWKHLVASNVAYATAALRRSIEQLVPEAEGEANDRVET
jgi:fatty-acyl-CoA synthase